MNIANFFRSAAGVVWADVESVFTKAKAFVVAAPLPSNIKADLTSTLTDTQSDLSSVTSLAGTVAGQAVADGVDDLTTLLVNTAGALSGGKSLSQLSAAEKSVLAQTWTVMKAQGETLVAQLQAGLDPTKPSAPAAPTTAPQAQAA